MAKSKSLVLETQQLLRKRHPKGIMKDCQEQGFKKRWLYKMRNGETSDPPVQLTQDLYEYLSGKRLVA